MPRNRLRNVEKLVLSKLELDARTPYSRIGRSARKSQQQVSYTVNSLIGRGIITGFHTLIDYSKMDVLNFRVYFKVNYAGEEKFRKLISYLVKESHTSWIASCGGRYDLICTFFTLNPSQFNKTLRSLMEGFPEQLQNYSVLTTAVNREFGRKYLFKSHSAVPQIILGGDREPEDIDETDMKILDELSADARKSSVTIGSRVSLTPRSVIERIRKLRKRGIIRGFKPLLDLEGMGHSSNLLLVRYHNVSVDMENELINYLKAHPNVVGIAKTLGEWDLEMEIETPNTAEFRKVEMELRQRFTLLVQQTESIPLYRTYKKDYFPRFLLEGQ